MKKNRDKPIREDTFSGIKKTLDASKSYIIFENDLAKGKKSIFSGEVTGTRYLEKEGHAWQQVMDADLRREYLVIQAAPGEEEEILGKMIGCGFPRDTVYYVFKAQEM